MAIPVEHIPRVVQHRHRRRISPEEALYGEHDEELHVEETLTAIQSSGLTESQLYDPVPIMNTPKTRGNTGRNWHVWRQKFAQRAQRSGESLDDWHYARVIRRR